MNTMQADTDTTDTTGSIVGSIDAVDQYLTFIMDNEEYGVDILAVKEIRNWDSATPIPRAPPHVRGVINLRGTIIPIIDLRQCFGMAAIEYGPLTVVLVLQVTTMGNDSREVGIVVDAVSDVYSLDSADIKPAPQMSDQLNTSFIRGLVTIKEHMVILLDIDNLLGREDLSDFAEVRDAIKKDELVKAV
ncbi:MAG: purine-binding chemotaxis protein CheW [Candidatus Azotimanducaceae bacterium]|jgi:purine-binding chemotaxis protein CheW